MVGIVIAIIGVYQKMVSPALGRNCRFSPSCSSYAIEAMAAHGLVRGLVLSVQRLGRCHPLHEGGYDPVPGGEVERT